MTGRTLAPYLLLLLVLAGSPWLLPWDAGVAAVAASALEEPMAQALKSYQRGAFEDAAAGWTQAARLYEQAGKLNEQSEALISLAQAYQAMGHYAKALQSLQSALSLVKRSRERSRLARTNGLIGALYIVSGQPEEASQYLNEGLQLAKEVGNTGLAASILNDKGNLLASQKKYEEAIEEYKESLSLGRVTKNHALVARALINAAAASQQSGRHQDARDRLDQALEQVQTLKDSYDKAYSLVSIGLAYKDLRPHLPGTNGALMLQAFRSLDEAVKVAAAIENPLATSYALGHLGSLYETERRYADALDLTRRAVMAGQQVVAPEALYRWHWQTGRLLNAQGKRGEAIEAYRRAVMALESIRPELLAASRSGPSSFRESVGPVFFELADLLLQEAASFPEPEQAKPFLKGAMEAVEAFKVTELRDYFRDQCVEAAKARSMSVEQVSGTAAVIYPIIFHDRTELLVSLAGRLRQVTVQVGEKTLIQEVRAFRRHVEKRTTREYVPHAQQLYDWLIRPLEPLLASSPVDTLVFVPDGSLRTIPMAALHDGKQFLVSKYAIAVTPALSLTDPRPPSRSAFKPLSVGLTLSVQNYPPLPYVLEELQAIQNLYPGMLLLNGEFVLPNFKNELKEGRFSIVHIASHGQFKDDVRKTFLLTFDDKLTMDRLDQYVGLLRFRSDPLELLTLSACQTAVGDDRAALGLAGVAIKAGAKSALATLWFINDPAAAVLISEFYRQLQAPTVSKAVALQRAQLKLLNDPVYDHPAYWSSFLLINNWL